MRRGQNPSKELKLPAHTPAPITVGVLNYIPEEAGYFTGVFDALRLCLASIREHADCAFDLMVVDNRSCVEVRRYLQQELAANRIQYLLLNSFNIGKANALLQILHAAPGDYVFYSDGDIYFKPGWMQAHLEIAETYPNVGLIGGIPLRNMADSFTANTLRWVDQVRSQLDMCETGHLIPEEWVRDFLRSVGSEAFFENWQHLQETRVVFHGVTAFVGASHMQFLISRETINCLPRRRFEMALQASEDQIFDRVIEETGRLRLSTAQPYVYHIGNTLSEDWLLDEFNRLVKVSPTTTSERIGNRSHWFWGRYRIKRLLRAIYQWSFDKYHGTTYR